MEVLRSSDGMVRGARVKVCSKSGHGSVLKRPVQQLFPLEVGDTMNSPKDPPLEVESNHRQSRECETTQREPAPSTLTSRERPRRAAAIEAQQRLRQLASDDVG